ncbi:MAG: hypothetical protein K0R85_175 [Devosia sp.]|jgi:hypothetical protein|nr:hypothetical protein [Devosia sp.]
MAVLPNPKHEAFAQARAAGNSADDAYAQAGFRPHRGNAHRLSTNESIKRRVREIVGRVAEKAEWTAADRLKMLADIAAAAAEKDPRVAVSAIAEANKMQGSHAPARLQHSGSVGTYDLTKVTDEQLDHLESILGPLALAGGDQSGAAEA